jgi:hypothetical protein
MKNMLLHLVLSCSSALVLF